VENVARTSRRARPLQGHRLGVGLGLAPEVDLQLEAGSSGAAFVVLPAIAVAGWPAATRRYRRADID
jgi:hypothetical protein